MKSYKQKISDQLEINGWEVASIDSDHSDWWAEEVWELHSTWSPIGAKCYLTFLVDPQSNNTAKSNAAVWAIGASPNRPSSIAQAHAHGCITFNKQFKNNIEDFLFNLEEIRNISTNR